MRAFFASKIAAHMQPEPHNVDVWLRVHVCKIFTESNVSAMREEKCEYLNQYLNFPKFPTAQKSANAEFDSFPFKRGPAFDEASSLGLPARRTFVESGALW